MTTPTEAREMIAKLRSRAITTKDLSAAADMLAADAQEQHLQAIAEFGELQNAQQGWQLVPTTPTAEMIGSYLAANADYWQRTDALPKTNPSRWRQGTPSGATEAGYQAMLAAAPQPLQPEAQQAADTCSPSGDCVGVLGGCYEDTYGHAPSGMSCAKRAQQVAVPQETPYSNCRFKICDLPGQCRGEGKCHHPEAPQPSATDVDLMAAFTNFRASQESAPMPTSEEMEEMVFGQQVSDLGHVFDCHLMKAKLQQALETAYERGWVEAARWARRDDLCADVGSPAYIADREAHLDALREAIAAPEPVAVAWIIEATAVDIDGKLTHLRDIDYFPEEIETLPIGTKLYAKEQP